MCSVGGGLEGSLVLRVSSGVDFGTSSYGASYDVGEVSGVSGTNGGKSGSMSPSLSGAGFGSRRRGISIASNLCILFCFAP